MNKKSTASFGIISNQSSDKQALIDDKKEDYFNTENQKKSF